MSNKITNISNAQGLEEIRNLLDDDRKAILSHLEKHKWFKNTSFEVQKDLLSLPNDFDGYLHDLTDRKDEIGGLIVIRLKRFLISFKSILNVFEVMVGQTNQLVEYEYISSKYGKNPGFKGVLLLQIDGELKYFIIKKSERFAVGGQKVYDTIGGFIQFRHGKLENLPKKIDNEIKRQLGIQSLEVKRFIDLGLVYPNVGLESGHESLFAAIIEADTARHIKLLADQHQTLKTKKNTFELVIIPIEKMAQFVEKVDDSFFLACVSRLFARGIIKL